MKITYTDQQKDVLEYVKHNEGILLIDAKAGTSKTFISTEVVRTLEIEKVLYTSFNKSIVEEAKGKFKGSMIECKTYHALAYKYTKPKKVQELSYRTMEGSYAFKRKIIDGIDSFFLSNSVDMYKYFDEYFKEDKNTENLEEYAAEVVEEMIEHRRPWSFGFMLKYFHILLEHGDVNPDYNLVIMDEINDATAVSLEIFRLLKAPRKLALGDPHQAIYAFMNLKSGFEYFKGEQVLELSHSFRCSAKIAERIQGFMQKNLDEDFHFTGTKEAKPDGNTLVATRTNSAIIARIQERLAVGKGFTLLRAPSDIFACVLALSSARAGKEVYQKQYRYLEDIFRKWRTAGDKEEKFFGYLQRHVKDVEIKSGISTIAQLSSQGVGIFELYAKVKTCKKDPTYTISTAFTAKGMEYSTVYIDDSLNKAVAKIIATGGATTSEEVAEIRLAYVACSRAKETLINAVCLDL